MNPTSKKLTALFLVFTLLTINCFPKRRGIKLNVTKADGQPIKGELIAVKPNSLLLLATEGKDVSVDIADIKVIKIVKKSKFWKGAALGITAGAGLAALLKGPDVLLVPIFAAAPILLLSYEYKDGRSKTETYLYCTLAGFLFGAIIGAFVIKDKTIQIEGMTDSEIQDTLDKLRKKARIRDYK
jgi:hypothetical protein